MRPRHDDKAERGESVVARPVPVDKLLAASVARRYYLENQSKVDIADEFNISRFKVARLLDAAVAHDIVRIDITVPVQVDVPLGRALTERFGLRQAVVVDLARSEDNGASGDQRRISRWLGTAAAGLISEIAEEGDVLGLDGSQSAEALSQTVTQLPPCEVVQLTGVVGLDLANDPAVAAVRRTAEAAGGRAFPLYAPFVLPNAPTAAVLRSQPAIGETLTRFGQVTKAVVEIGAWDAAPASVYDAMTDQERATYRASGACADVVGHVFDPAGNEITTEFNARLITMSAAEFRGIADRIGVSGGEHRAEAIHAVLKAGLLTGVVTDVTTARRLLWCDGWSDRQLGEVLSVAEADT